MTSNVEVVEITEVSAETINQLIDDLGIEESSVQSESETEEQPKQIIPLNSPSILIDESSSRFSSATWYNAVRTKSILLAGVGGIGRLGNLKNYYYLCA